MTDLKTTVRRYALLSLMLLFAGCSSVHVIDNGTVIGTWSANGTLQVVVGGSETVTLTFTTTLGAAATDFQVVTGNLPAGWSAINAPLHCSRVSKGSGCLLALRYTPLAAGAGTLSIPFQFVDSTGKSSGGFASLSYDATSHDNIVATVTPVGQLSVVTGGVQSVSVQFTTDDGAQATNLKLSAALAALPPDWATPGTTFGCATVSVGNGCQLQLTFAPSTTGSGTLTLPYSYNDDAGEAKSGSVSIPYVVSSDNNVLATPSPAGQITAVIGGRNVAVTIGFTTDDGNPATDLQITAGLGALPAGWSGPLTFLCATVSVGNGCALNLSYSPTAVASGSLIFSYQYTSTAGVLKTGSVSVPFVATADNNVIATPSPAGQISALAGGTGTAVTVTFTTDDGNLASNLAITSNLAALPAGWSAPTAGNPPAFGCATLASGGGCQLALQFNPTTVVSGTLQLNFSYDSNAGAAKTGSVSIPYGTSSHNQLVATVSPSGQVTAELNQGTQVATITFTSSDANPISNVVVTSGLGTLPADWTGPASFTCASATTGNGCALPLQFQPTSASDNGTLALTYTYVDDAGAAQSGSVNVPYAAVPIYFYVDQQGNSVERCAASFTDGSLSGCIPVASGFGTPYGIVFNGNNAYIADQTAGTVSLCPVNIDGTLAACTIATAPGPNPYTTPNAMGIFNGILYTLDSNGATPVTGCVIDGDGSLSGCGTTAWSAPSPLNVADGIATATAVSSGTSYAYIVDNQGGNLTICSISLLDGELLNCTQSPIGSTPTGAAIYNGNLYVGTGDGGGSGIKRCPIAADGSVNVAGCVFTGQTATLSQAVGFAFYGGYAYISGYGGASGAVGGVYVCPITIASGNLDNCVLSSDPAISGHNHLGLAAH